MTGAIVIATAGLGFTSSSATVGGLTFRGHAVTENDAGASADQRVSVRSRSVHCPPGAKPAGVGCIDRHPVMLMACPSARGAVRFYGVRVDYWRSLMGATAKDLGHAQTGKRCPRYLAHVLQRKAYGLRAHYARWYERQIATHVRRLDRGLAGTPMAGTGEILERYGRRYHVSPYFMAAVAATESSLGEAACSNNRFNVWGLSSCGSGWYVPAFRSWDEAIRFYARFLSGRWPSHSTPYSFRGYAACSDCWGRKVSEWMGRLFGVPARTVYP